MFCPFHAHCAKRRNPQKNQSKHDCPIAEVALTKIHSDLSFGRSGSRRERISRLRGMKLRRSTEKYFLDKLRL